MTTISGNVVPLLLVVKVWPAFMVTEMIFVAEAKGLS